MQVVIQYGRSGCAWLYAVIACSGTVPSLPGSKPTLTARRTRRVAKTLSLPDELVTAAWLHNIGSPRLSIPTNPITGSGVFVRGVSEAA
jgi:hypothetical protein